MVKGVKECQRQVRGVSSLPFVLDGGPVLDYIPPPSPREGECSRNGGGDTMARWSLRRGRVTWLVAAISLSFGLVGCGQSSSSPDSAATSDPKPAPTTAIPAPGTATTPVVSATTEPARDALCQSFAQATRAADNPPDDSQR